MRVCKAILVAVLGSLLLANAAWAQPAYHVTYINTFDEKNEALDISDSGRYVCGYYLEGGGGTAQRAYLYDTGDKSVTDLSCVIEAEIGGARTIGYGVNDAGQVVGQAYYIDGGVGKTTGFLYDHASQTVTKLELANSDEGSAMDINNAGRVVGYSHAPAWHSPWPTHTDTDCSD